MSELLPCPFCGGEASKRLFYKGKYRVHCNVCDAHSGDVCDTEVEAIAAWNTRADYHGYEQAAIEAWESIKAWNTRVAHGTLTAEQVRDAIRKHAHDDSCYIFEVYGEECDAIADELNATLGSGECEIETTESWLPAERYHRCKNCGAFFAVMNASEDIPPCVCPNCGKAVKR